MTDFPLKRLKILGLMAVLAMMAGVLLLAAPAVRAQTSAPAPAPCNPLISESSANPFWDSYGDYLARRLTVDE
jgi:hypothetical protein